MPHTTPDQQYPDLPLPLGVVEVCQWWTDPGQPTQRTIFGAKRKIVGLVCTHWRVRSSAPVRRR